MKNQLSGTLGVIFYQTAIHTDPRRDGSRLPAFKNKRSRIRERSQYLLALTAPVRSIPNTDITYNFRAMTLGTYSR